jgi:hypothetical protein
MDDNAAGPAYVEGAIGPSGSPPHLWYLHGLQEGLEIAQQIVWDETGNPAAVEVATCHIQQVLNELKPDRLEAAVRAAGIDELQGFLAIPPARPRSSGRSDTGTDRASLHRDGGGG